MGEQRARGSKQREQQQHAHSPPSHAHSHSRTLPAPAQKNVVLWPFTTIRYHWETQSVVWDSYNIVEAAKAKA